jgi:hypothetical protein
LHFILQEQNAGLGEHIIRARGAWFGNRSISAEVDLEAGVYEVLPKIEATRDADAPDVPEVVSRLAERNPQKLRQIGLNYDIANAKGVFELSEEEQKKKEQKKKDAIEKKTKDKEAKKKEKTEFAAWRKEKTEFEAWKKEERAEYEAWKKEKNEREVKDDGKEAEILEEVPAGSDSTPKPTAATTGEPEDAGQTDEKPPSSNIEDKQDAPTDLTIQLKDSPDKIEPPTEPVPEPHILINNRDGNLTPISDYSEDNYPYTSPFPRPRSPHQPLPLPSRYQPLPPPDYRRYPGGNRVYGGGVPPPRGVPRMQEPKPWNAVCVLGLRVYSLDPEVSIKLVKPKDVEEGAILDVDGETAAGATM